MSTDYPTSKQSFTNPQSTDAMSSPSHSDQHATENDTIEALQDKLGIGSSTPTSGKLLIGDGAGSSSWSNTITSPVLNTAVSGSAVLDEDDLVSDSATKIATQQSIKKYVDDKTGANTFRIDQSGGTSDTYGVLSGTINGTNTTFTVSNTSYISGSLMVYLNGQLQTQGSSEDWTETTPVAGTFDFATAPESGDQITVTYYYF